MLRNRFINPARAGGVRNFHSHPATRVGSERWPELAQSSSLRLRSIVDVDRVAIGVHRIPAGKQNVIAVPLLGVVDRERQQSS
jgi:hypothetical protein